MANLKGFLLLSLLLLSLILLHQAQAADHLDGEAVNDVSDHRAKKGHKINCGSACKVRCQLSSRPNLCHRACGTCCKRCSCVPPGTSGNYNACPCYASLTTHHNRRKCP